MQNSESDARALWSMGISSEYATKLTCKDVKEFVERELNLKCGRITKSKKSTLGKGIDFVIRKPFRFRKNPFWADTLAIEPCGVREITFTAYDFKFVLPSECSVSDSDVQAWIDHMADKFGKQYVQFMFIYSDDEEQSLV